VPDTVTDTITVLNSGVYEITAGVIVETQASSVNINFVIQAGGTDLDGSYFFTSLPSNSRQTIGKTVQANLSAGTQVTVIIQGGAAQNFYRSASLTVTLLS
jgi:hypothetical protein